MYVYRSKRLLEKKASHLSRARGGKEEKQFSRIWRYGAVLLPSYFLFPLSLARSRAFSSSLSVARRVLSANLSVLLSRPLANAVESVTFS